MLGVAAVVGGAVRGDGQQASAEPDAATTAAGHRAGPAGGDPAGLPADLEQLQRATAGAGGRSVRAAGGGGGAQRRERGQRVARAVDAVDDAVARAEGVARQMPRSGEVRASVQRMLTRRRGLLDQAHRCCRRGRRGLRQAVGAVHHRGSGRRGHRRRQRGRAGQRLAGRDPRGVRRAGGRRLLHPSAALSNPGRPPWPLPVPRPDGPSPSLGRVGASAAHHHRETRALALPRRPLRHRRARPPRPARIRRGPGDEHGPGRGCSPWPPRSWPRTCWWRWSRPPCARRWAGAAC